MDTLKFRAWNELAQKMYYEGFAIIPTSPNWSATFIRGLHDSEIQYLINNYYTSKGDILNGDYDLIDWTEFSELKLMLYTGLKDKNGVEICQSDIVKYHFNKRWDCPGDDYIDSDKYLNAEVKYKPCSFYLCGNEEYKPNLTNYCIDEIEVIGNIHENKHLLK